MKSILNRRYGKLLVIEELPRYRSRVKCDCGTVKVVNRCALLSDNTKSCGCVGRQAIREAEIEAKRTDALRREMWKKGYL